MVMRTQKSRYAFLAGGLLLLLPMAGFAEDVATPAASAEPAAPAAPAGEIVYRTNLGRADDVKLLISQGASPNQTNPDGVPLIALAASRIDPEGINVLKALLEAGADVNGKDGIGRNALFYAAEKGNKNAVALLLEKNIDYYAVDANGDIPRNMAHNARHDDVVKQIDDFVRTQTQKVREQYKEFGKQMNPETPTPQITDKSVAMDSQSDEDDGYVDEEEPKKPAEGDAFKNALQELAFHNCAFQYWSYIRAIKQSSPLSADEMDIAIDSHKERILSLQAELFDEYEIDAKRLERVSNTAKKSIFQILDRMPSKSFRREQGVGRMEDMQARCDELKRHAQEF